MEIDLTTHEIILKWVELLLQGQVLAFILGLVAFLFWKDELAGLIKAIAQKGGKFSAGPVSGEIGAGAQEGAMPINSNNSKGSGGVSETLLSDPHQFKLLQRLALRFEDISRQGANKRSLFVDDIRREYSTGWTWESLYKSFENESQYIRFCAAALLTTKDVKFDPVSVSGLLQRESSSLVRFRLVESLLYWATSPGISEELKYKVRNIVRKHAEENTYVAEKVYELIKILST